MTADDRQQVRPRAWDDVDDGVPTASGRDPTPSGDLVGEFGQGGYARFGTAGRRERVYDVAFQGEAPILAGPSEPTSGATPENSAMLLLRLTGDGIFADGFD